MTNENPIKCTKRFLNHKKGIVDQCNRKAIYIKNIDSEHTTYFALCKKHKGDN